MSLHSHGFAGSWSRQEFAGFDLKDTRLTERIVGIADAFSAQPLSPISAACQDWAGVKGAYRFFDNEKVTAAKILQPHFERTIERMCSHERVFAIQDTTYLDYTDHPATQGLGPIGTKAQKRQGLVKHTTLVVSASGVPLGCLTDTVVYSPLAHRSLFQSPQVRHPSRANPTPNQRPAPTIHRLDERHRLATLLDNAFQSARTHGPMHTHLDRNGMEGTLHNHPQDTQSASQNAYRCWIPPGAPCSFGLCKPSRYLACGVALGGL